MNFQTVCIVHDAVPHCSVTVLVFQMFICPILIIREHVSIGLSEGFFLFGVYFEYNVLMMNDKRWRPSKQH